MGKSAGIRRETVVQAARDVVEESGHEALSLGEVARRLGVKTPSLYHHIDGIADLGREVAMFAATQLAQALGTANSEDALAEMCRRYRSWVGANPGLYASLFPAPTPESDPDLAAAMYRSVEIVSCAMELAGIDASTDSVRALRSAIHGFVSLERHGGFGLGGDLDASFETLIRSVVSGLIHESTTRRIQ